jgi:hypothetical protein
MKIRLLALSFVFLLLANCNKSKESETAGKTVLTISVDYERQSGHGSNQYAVWIEDKDSVLVKTLFVTAYTADGGYKPRPACVPIWVKKANPEKLSGESIDAFSGATPLSGLQTYEWDFTDEENRPVSGEKYYVVVEGTLYGDSEVIYKVPVTVGEKSSSAYAQAFYTSDDDKNKNMIRSVSVEYRE